MRTLLVALLLASSAHAAEPARHRRQATPRRTRGGPQEERPARDGRRHRALSGVALVDVVGVRKRGDDTKATVDDQFHIGSDTKAMTATLVALLVQDKKLSYDMTLEKALPDLAKKMHKDLPAVTLEQLLSHRAGLGATSPAAVEDPAQRARPRDAHRRRPGRPRGGARVAPGVKFAYSNLGYVVVGAVCERAGKDDWESLLKKHVFTPLGMKSAGFGAAGTRGKIDQPLPHNEAGKPVEPGPGADNPPVFGPAGRVHCSLGDWGKFIADQLKGARGKKGLLPAAAYKKLQTPRPGARLHAGRLALRQDPRRRLPRPRRQQHHEPRLAPS